MNTQNKKLVMYIGGAFIVGAIGYYAYYKLFSNDVVVGNTSITLDESQSQSNAPVKSNPSYTKPLYLSQTSGITTPNIKQDLMNLFK